VLFLAATLVAKKWRFDASWTLWLPFYFLGFLLLANANYPWAHNYNNMVCNAVELPRYFLGELGLVMLVAIGAWFYRRLRPQGNLLWLDFLSLGLIALAFLDFRLSRIMGVRLEWGVLTFGDSPKMMWRMAQPYLPGVAAALGVGTLAYVAVCQVSGRWFRRRQSDGEGVLGNGLVFVTVCFLLLGGLGLALAKSDKALGQSTLTFVRTSPVWKRSLARTMSEQEFLRTARALGMGDFTEATAPSARPRRELNLVFILMESAYNKHLSLFGADVETQPLLSQY